MNQCHAIRSKSNTSIRSSEFVWGPFKYAKIKHFSAPRACIPEFFPAERQVRIWLKIPLPRPSSWSYKWLVIVNRFLHFSRADSVCRSDGVPRDVLLPDVPFHRLGMSCCDDLDLGSHHGVLLSPEVKVRFFARCIQLITFNLKVKCSLTFSPLHSTGDSVAIWPHKVKLLREIQY